ncbi:hypothetical protein M9H77_35485 [Catharanthus roseus]|uniref:Uncharacterized protein n=1 Tax=Catharanthus roseus TaxID=4058 RepID=A0ACB9ZSU0_CATRO|nr:hypothetical protein M9H77_35485 [Catharanthus roseus]
MEVKGKQEDYQSKHARDMHNFPHGGGNGFNAYGGNNHGNKTSLLKDIIELVTSLLMLNLMDILFMMIMRVMIELILDMIIISIVLMIVMQSIIMVMMEVSGGFKVLKHFLDYALASLSQWFVTLILSYYIDLVRLQVLGLKFSYKNPDQVFGTVARERNKSMQPQDFIDRRTRIQTHTIQTGEIILISPGEKVLSALKDLEAMTQILDSHTQSITKLETQIGQLANALNRRDEENSSWIVNHEPNMRKIDPG